MLVDYRNFMPSLRPIAKTSLRPNVFCRDEKSLDELERDLMNFNSENRVCFKCHKRGQLSKQCRENLGSRRDSEDKTQFSFLSVSGQGLRRRLWSHR